MESKGPTVYAVRKPLNTFVINILVSVQLVVKVARYSSVFFTYSSRSCFKPRGEIALTAIFYYMFFPQMFSFSVFVHMTRLSYATQSVSNLL